MQASPGALELRDTHATLGCCMKSSLDARRLAIALAAVLAAPAASLVAQEHPVAFRGARIETAVAPAIADGVLVVQGGKIIAVGPAGTITIPDGAEIHDVAGSVIMPGIVDTHSHLGGTVNERSGPVQADLRVLDSIDPRDDGFRRALSGGLTTVNIMPGSGNVIGGQTIYLKLRRSVDIDDLYIRDADGKPTGGLKMANGTNPIGTAPYQRHARGLPQSRAPSS
jgi:imidazolonepropionase-like amidohydrolase